MNAPPRSLESALQGRFVIEREIGQGGMATVYLARDAKTGRRVALKVLFPELAATVTGERFLREIEYGARLAHPRIVPILDSGQADGFVYFAMPYVEGESLRQRLERERRLLVPEALEITRQVATALEHAHEQGLVHRDMKPANIMLSPEGAVVMDFGIARAVDEAGGDRLTEAGLAMGTPEYMAPEQADGRDAVDGRADLYGLACVLYEMLAGEPPFLGASAKTVLSRHARDPVPPLSSARPDVTGPVEAVLNRALAKVPADRFRSGGQLAQALEMAEQGVTPRGVTPVEIPVPRALVAAVRQLRLGRVAGVTAALVAAAALGWAASRAMDGNGPEAPRIEARLDPGSERVWLSGEVEAGSYAVMPFEVASGDSAVAAAGSSVAQLLTDLLNYGRRTRAAFAAVEGESGEEARRRALEARSEYTVTGTVVGQRERITVQARLARTRSGRVVANEAVDGPLDSLRSLAVRLGLQLAVGGDPAVREIIATTPTAAVEAALHGFVALSRLEYGAATDRFDRALTIDSTFGVAAEGLWWATNIPGSTRGNRRFDAGAKVLSLFDRMGKGGQAFHRARVGRDSTRRRHQSEILGDWEEAARANPNNTQVWNRLAYQYVWAGAFLGIEDWHRRALHAFQQQAELMDQPIACEAFHVFARQAEPDADGLALWRRHCEGVPVETDPAVRVFARLWHAAALGDTAELYRLRTSDALDSIPGFSGRAFLFYHVPEGRLTEWEAAIESWARRASTVEDQFHVAQSRYWLALVKGRPAEAATHMEAAIQASLQNPVWPYDPYWISGAPIVSALLEPGWEEAAARGGERMVSPPPSWPDTMPDGPPSWNNSSDRLCHAEMARVGRGDTTRTSRSVQILRELRAGPVESVRACSELVDAIREQLRDDGGSQALARLDSVMRLGSDENGWDQAINNLILARLYRARGDTARAWEWVRRWRWASWAGPVLPAWLRSQGRIAAAVGERDFAIRAYRRYLALREDPEPVLVPQRDSVLTELACLDPELADRRDPAVCTELLGEP